MKFYSESNKVSLVNQEIMNHFVVKSNSKQYWINISSKDRQRITLYKNDILYEKEKLL